MTDRLRYVLAAGLVVFYLSYADRVRQVGEIWHSQVYPQNDVEVMKAENGLMEN